MDADFTFRGFRSIDSDPPKQGDRHVIAMESPRDVHAATRGDRVADSWLKAATTAQLSSRNPVVRHR
ncbi:hypothetical protein [Streptomyces sp. NPDC059743]|uniref:hypothetical protein n=1 Tax=Streptomyces sp. NPDC059743 TaxID=3346928 RepID=UPI003658F424